MQDFGSHFSSLVLVPLCELHDMHVLSSVPDLLLKNTHFTYDSVDVTVNYSAAAQQWCKCGVPRTRFSTSVSLETNR